MVGRCALVLWVWGRGSTGSVTQLNGGGEMWWAWVLAWVSGLGQLCSCGVWRGGRVRCGSKRCQVTRLLECLVSED